MESAPTEDKVPLPNIRTNPQGRRYDAPFVGQKSNTVGGHSICPRCMESNFNSGGSKPPPYG